MKLPPDDSDDITPQESTIKTIDVSELPTLDIGGSRADVTVSSCVDVHTLVRARQGARAAAFAECPRTCKWRAPLRAYNRVAEFCKRWARRVLVGAAIALFGVAFGVAFIYCWLRYWR